MGREQGTTGALFLSIVAGLYCWRMLRIKLEGIKQSSRADFIKEFMNQGNFENLKEKNEHRKLFAPVENK